MIVGLTGISGAGKSTVCGILRKGGFEIIDCDGIARDVADNRGFLSELQTRFNADVLNADGTLNRAETARLIFNDKGKLHLYNSIIFPYIIYDIIGRIRSSSKDTVLDAPTLFDCGIDMICNKIIGVISNREICAKRIILRDRITEEKALERLSIQENEDFFKTNCDYIIENNGELSELVSITENTVNKLKGLT